MTPSAQEAQRRIKKALVILSVLSALGVKASAQISFQKTYGDSIVNDNGQSIIQTSDGGFMIVATRFTTGNWIESLFLIRTNSVGDTLWTKRIKEPTVNYSGAQVIQTFDGGFAITGFKGGGITFVPYLLKIDSSGNILWNKTYLWFADEHINSIVQTPDSGFLLAGYLYNGNNLVYFIRTDSVGDTLWTKSYGEAFYNASVYSVRIADDGGLIATGSIQDANTQDVDAFLFKTDSLGNVQWAKGYGDIGYDYAQQVDVTSDSGFVIAAVTYSFGAGLADFFLIKTDASGTPQWAKTYGGSSDDRSEAVRQTADGGYLFTGESASFSFGNFDGYMIRTDSNGDTLWTRTVNGLQNNEGYSMVLTSDSGFVITGTYLNLFSNNDVLLLKSDASGMLGCEAGSSATTVANPLTQVVNHHMSFSPSSPSVISHILDVSSGARVETICDPVQIAEINSDENLFLIYPNPVQDKLAIGSWQAPIGSIEILSILGTDVLAFRPIVIRMPIVDYEFPVEIDVSMLPPGIYFIKAQCGTDLIVRKFIKQ